MANEKIHEYLDIADDAMLGQNKNFFDADMLVNGSWTSVKVAADALRRFIVFGTDPNGNYTGLWLAVLTTNEILAIPNPQIGAVVFNSTHDTVCFYASNGWQRLNHQPM